MEKYGPQYWHDDEFKKIARLHQSKYRAEVLQVGFNEYGNRLTDEDAKALKAYYPELGVRKALRERYSNYSSMRDADLLRSEHIPFNFFAPLINDFALCRELVDSAFGISLDKVDTVKIEYAPKPRKRYLNDSTSFDTYIRGLRKGNQVGIGIEVKYTEQAYSLKKGSPEELAVNDPTSAYWTLTRSSGVFAEPGNSILGGDPLRQVWRNHLLGLSMIEKGDVDAFYSVTLFPDENKHFHYILPEYQTLLTPESRQFLIGCSFEKFIGAIPEEGDYGKWKQYLMARYIVDNNL